MTKNLEEMILQELFKLSDKIDKMQDKMGNMQNEMKNMVTQKNLKDLEERMEQKFDKKLEQRLKEQEERIEKNFNKKLDERLQKQTEDLTEMFRDMYGYNERYLKKAEIRIMQKVDERIKNLRVV